MLQNKIYLNFILELFKTFFLILLGFSLIALTVRAVSFLDLIVESGYPISTYFFYSALNIFGFAPKFIPLSFLIALIIFIIKHDHEGELIILWTSGVKKIKFVNLFLSISLFVTIVYILFSAYLTPLALNKSRELLSNEKYNSLLPTIKKQTFGDSFEGFTFIVEQKNGSEVKNIFLHDNGKNFKKLSANKNKSKETTVIAQSGILEKDKFFLINGQVISNKDNGETDVVKFEELIIDLTSLKSTTIKQPKVQETSTFKLISCFGDGATLYSKICSDDFKKELYPILNRRLVLPFYIPAISLICSFLLIKSQKKYFNRLFVFTYSFLLLLFTELVVRYTGLSFILRISFILLPIILSALIYFSLIYQFSKELKTK